MVCPPFSRLGGCLGSHADLRSRRFPPPICTDAASPAFASQDEGGIKSLAAGHPRPVLPFDKLRANGGIRTGATVRMQVMHTAVTPAKAGVWTLDIFLFRPKTPAKARGQSSACDVLGKPWIPAFAAMTACTFQTPCNLLILLTSKSCLSRADMNGPVPIDIFTFRAHSS